jgi:hypothetical protein
MVADFLGGSVETKAKGKNDEQKRREESIDRIVRATAGKENNCQNHNCGSHRHGLSPSTKKCTLRS